MDFMSFFLKSQFFIPFGTFFEHDYTPARTSTTAKLFLWHFSVSRGQKSGKLWHSLACLFLSQSLTELLCVSFVCKSMEILFSFKNIQKKGMKERWSYLPLNAFSNLCGFSFLIFKKGSDINLWQRNSINAEDMFMWSKLEYIERKPSAYPKIWKT